MTDRLMAPPCVAVAMRTPMPGLTRSLISQGSPVDMVAVSSCCRQCHFVAVSRAAQDRAGPADSGRPRNAEAAHPLAVHRVRGRQPLPARIARAPIQAPPDDSVVAAPVQRLDGRDPGDVITGVGVLRSTVTARPLASRSNTLGWRSSTSFALLRARGAPVCVPPWPRTGSRRAPRSARAAAAPMQNQRAYAPGLLRRDESLAEVRERAVDDGESALGPIRRREREIDAGGRKAKTASLAEHVERLVGAGSGREAGGNTGLPTCRYRVTQRSKSGQSMSGAQKSTAGAVTR